MRILRFLRSHKVITINIIIILIIINGGYWWQKNQKQEPAIIMSPPIVSPTLQYPKITKYQVPILMYHYIRDAKNESQLGKNLSVNPENFDLQVKWLKENNYEALKVSDLVDSDKNALSKIAFLHKKPIIFTFDDGYADAYSQALPILKKYQMTATFYIIRNYVGKDNYMNQTQIDALEKEGFEIGSHTLSHPDLTKIGLDDARTQIFDSRQNAFTFCYPGGKYNTTTVEQVQEAGYKAAVTTHFGITDQDSSILELPRVRVEDGSGETLGHKIEAAYEQSKK